MGDQPTQTNDDQTIKKVQDKQPNPLTADEQLSFVIELLEDAKAEDVVTIDLKDKSSIGDYMVVATGRSHRHVGSTANKLERAFRDRGFGHLRLEGMNNCDWVLLDSHDIIIHLFRPEVREFYNLEKMWLAERPADETAEL